METTETDVRKMATPALPPVSQPLSDCSTAGFPAAVRGLSRNATTPCRTLNVRAVAVLWV